MTMINLLPPEQKKELLQEERHKLVLILGLLIVFFLASLFLILLSIKIYISGGVLSQKILVDSEEEKFKISEIQKLEEEIKSTNQNLEKLTSFYKGQPNLTELLEKISKILPEKTYLTTFTLTSSDKEKKIKISLGGYSPTRELLFEFKKRLEAEPDFKEIYFPPSNWIKPKDIDFLATFQYGYQ